MIRVRDVVSAMERLAAPTLALEGDPVGLAAGDPEQPVARVLVTLDATLGVIGEAEAARADMIVSHHPRFYRGLKTLATVDASGRRAWMLARSGIALYCAHTNLDLAPGGTNDLLAAAAGIKDPAIALPAVSEPLVKLAVFVPATHVEAVREAMCAAGAGAIGGYSDCTFRVCGVGTFKGGADTNPFLGTPGKLEEADECRLETVIGEFSLPQALQALKAAHPYEEVAYDVYPLRRSAREYGLGRTGRLDTPTTLRSLASRLAEATGSTSTRMAGDAETEVECVATWAGGGVEADALSRLPIDALVVGEIGYHDLEVLLDRKIGVIELGHDFSETLVLPWVANQLVTAIPGLETVVAHGPSTPMRNVFSGNTPE
ncbi:MAG: Nif3-like dinuclear metal center hexameric protein [Planctomycetota bacterium]|jgi:dinuclear metal center YbgI/SA1388 family protein|nr:Nif3-like dinuclear metal center hexameric protein [Planctomycetota bacterium]